jgi:hypothetical protein
MAFWMAGRASSAFRPVAPWSRTLKTAAEIDAEKSPRRRAATKMRRLLGNVFELAAEQRKKVAPGVSPGFDVSKWQAPEGRQKSVCRSSGAFANNLRNPQLTLWATVCRTSGAEAD